MQPAPDIFFPRSRDADGRVRPLLLVLLLLAISPSLTGCRILTAATPAHVPTASVIPRQNPMPTVEVLDSEALYGQDSRSIGQTSPSLASFPAGAVLPPAPTGDSERDVVVLLGGGRFLVGELFQPDGLRRPGILLLGADVPGWGSLPARLSQEGFNVLVLAVWPLTQASDVETMLQSLIAVPGVDAGSIGVIGADFAADLAALGCAVNSLCDALALLSPRSRDTLLNMMPSFGGRPIWLAAGQDDREALDTASALADAATGEAQYVEVSAGRGVALLRRQPDLAGQLESWLQRQLQSR